MLPWGPGSSGESPGARWPKPDCGWLGVASWGTGQAGVQRWGRGTEGPCSDRREAGWESNGSWDPASTASGLGSQTGSIRDHGHPGEDSRHGQDRRVRSYHYASTGTIRDGDGWTGDRDQGGPGE